MGNENCDEDAKTWVCKGQGLYKHTPSGKLYWRTEVNGKRTFHVLEADNIKLAREEIEALKKARKNPAWSNRSNGSIRKQLRREQKLPVGVSDGSICADELEENACLRHGIR